MIKAPSRGVLAYAGEREKRAKPQLKPTNDARQVAATDIKVKGEWVYVSRAVDRDGNPTTVRALFINVGSLDVNRI